MQKVTLIAIYDHWDSIDKQLRQIAVDNHIDIVVKTDENKYLVIYTPRGFVK